jgi:2-methylcitrate dehydratase PrpD
MTDARLLDVSRLSAFVHETRWEDIPASVTSAARTLLFDSLGVLFGGLRYPAVQALGRTLHATEPTDGDAAPFARLVTLGTAATWLDADSGGSFHPQGHRLPPVPTAHPVPHSLPVLLHAAHTARHTDDVLLKAFLLANEVGMRFGTSTTLRPGMHPHGIHGPVASAVAASLLRRNAAEVTTQAILRAQAMPLAATLAVPMRGGTVRNIWTGLGAYYGAVAALQSEDGKQGSGPLIAELLDHAVCTDLSSETLAGDLGSIWRIADSYLKPYACARWIHPALDAWRAATSGVEGTVTGAEIAEILVETYAFAASLSEIGMDSDLHARFSLPVCIASLAMDGELHAASFLPDRLQRPSLRELAARVRVREVPEFSAALPHERPTRVTIKWSDGATTMGEVRNARGNPDDPLDPSEVESKFRRNVESILDAHAADALLASILHGPVGAGHTIAEATDQVIGRFCP